MSAMDVHKAVQRGYIEAVRQMVKANPSLKEELYRDWTPLQWSAYYGHLHIVRYLAGDAGVDKDKANMYGQTPLMIAAIFGRLDVVRYLLEEGANATLVDKHKYTCGGTALTYAEQNGHAEVAALLREYLPGGLMEQRRDAVKAAVLNQKDLGPDVAWFCGEFIMKLT